MEGGYRGRNSRSQYCVHLRCRIADNSNLLSDDIGIVAGFDFEGTVVGPEIDGDSDACDTPLIDLCTCQKPRFRREIPGAIPSLQPQFRQC
jgi:hypothetical protein